MRYLLIFLFLLKLYHCLDINDINSSDVFEAVSSGNMVTLKNILDEDSFIINSVTTDSGLSPLMLGVSQNKYSVVELLINYGANVHAVDNNGKYALFIAVELKYFKIIQLLLHAGANPRQQIIDGSTAIAVAYSMEDDALIKMLVVNDTEEDSISTTNTDDRDNNKSSDNNMNHKSAFEENRTPPPSFDYSDANVDTTTSSIIDDIDNKNEDILKDNSNINERVDEDENWSKMSVIDLHIAFWESSREGDLSTVKRMLSKNLITIDYENEYGWTALLFASASSQAPVVKLLLDQGADVHHRERDGWSSLMFAAHQGHLDTINNLILYGASPLDTASNGLSVVDAAMLKENYQDEIVSMLTAHGLKSALEAHNINRIMEMMEKGADPTINVDNGWTALHEFASSGNLEGVRMVLDRCKPNVKEKSTRVPIPGRNNMYGSDTSGSVAKERNKRSVGNLCDIRSIVNHADGKLGWTALMYATSINNEEIVRRLLAAGADTRITSKTSREETSSSLMADLDSHFGERVVIESPDMHINETAISIALERGFTYIADILRRSDILSQERAGIELSKLMKFRSLKETEAMEISKLDQKMREKHEKLQAEMDANEAEIQNAFNSFVSFLQKLF